MAKKPPDKRNRAPNGRAGRPRADRRKPRFAARTLWVGRIVLKSFDGPADVQELILKAFQEQNWKRCIDDPLPPRPGIKRQKRLQDAVRRLNCHQKVTLLKFHVCNRGTAIWREFLTLP